MLPHKRSTVWFRKYGLRGFGKRVTHVVEIGRRNQVLFGVGIFMRFFFENPPAHDQRQLRVGDLDSLIHHAWDT